MRSGGGPSKHLLPVVREQTANQMEFSMIPPVRLSLFCGGVGTLNRCRYFFNKSRMASSINMFKRRPCCVARVRISLRRSASTGPPIWVATWRCSLIETDASENTCKSQRLVGFRQLEPSSFQGFTGSLSFNRSSGALRIERLGRQV